MFVQLPSSQSNVQKQQGFTLVEVMISIVVAMVVLAGLMLTFTNQSNQYQYQNKRIDASQDLEFAIKFIARDFRSALVGLPVISITNQAVAPFATTGVKFEVWDSSYGTANGRVQRYYKYVAATKELRYDRDTTAIATVQLLPNVTFFKVFDDSVDPRVGYQGIPAAQPNVSVPDPANAQTPISVPSYTILIEIEVPLGYKGGSKVDVLGNAVATKRIWRYVQVYPMAAVR